MSYPEPHQEPYTKYPNRYNDVIKPLLTDTQKAVCDAVIRETIGWHRESAAISNTMFRTKTGKSEPAIIRAKKSLEEMGVLIVLAKGGGSKTSEYMLDLYYDNPDRSIKASLLQQQELIEKDTSEPQDDTEVPAVDEDPQPEMDDMDCEVALDSEADESHVDDEESTFDSNVDDCQVEMPDPVEAENPVDTGDSDTPNAALVPSIEDNNNIIIYNKNKQTADPENKEAKKERKEAIAAVCSLFRSWGKELEKKDYAFIGWCFKEYGLEAVNGKIQIMKFQRSRGIEFSNPLGWLRSAVMRDFGYSKWDSKVMKAKKRAKTGTERLRLEQEQRENEIREMERLRDEAEKMKAQLAPEDREDLRKAAIERIADMGVTSNWINEPLIKSVENKIIRERMADRHQSKYQEAV